MHDPADNPTLALVTTDEERLLRQTVRQICADFGPEYTRRKTDEGKSPRELWDALARRRYLGVNPVEEYGGGGLGMSALAAVGEQTVAAGCPLLLIVVSPAIVGSILARRGTRDPGCEGSRRAGTTRVAFDESGRRATDRLWNVQFVNEI